MSSAGRGSSVLVVEDSASVRQLLVRYVRHLGFHPIEAENGADALAILEQAPDIALVLTDLRMPLMDGRQLISAMRRDARLAELPVVQISTTFELADPRYPVLTKPFALAEVNAMMRAYARGPRPTRLGDAADLDH